MLGYKINKEDVKLIEKVNFLKCEFTDSVCNIYINASMTYGIEEYYLVGRIYKDYKAQGNYTYFDGVEKEYKTVKPVLNAIMKKYENSLEYDKILIFVGLKKDIKETRAYKNIVKAKELKEAENNNIKVDHNTNNPEKSNIDSSNSTITQTTEQQTQTSETNIIDSTITDDTIQLPTQDQQKYTHTEVYHDRTLSVYECNQKLYSLYENNLIKPIFTDHELECIKSNNESYYNRISSITKQMDWQKHLMLIDRDLTKLDKLYKLEEQLIRIKESYLTRYQEFKINKPVEKILKYKDYKDVFFNYIGFNNSDPRFRDDLIKHLLDHKNFNNIKDSYIRLKEKVIIQPDILETEGYKQYDLLVNKLEPIFTVYGTIDAWMSEQVI